MASCTIPVRLIDFEEVRECILALDGLLDECAKDGSNVNGTAAYERAGNALRCLINAFEAPASTANEPYGEANV